GTAGIINIKTKRDQRQGLNGSFNAFYGQGVYPKYGGGTNLNYRNKKFTAYLNYNYSMRHWFNHLVLNRKFYDTSSADLEKKLFSYEQDNYAKFNFGNHTVSTGIDYALSKKTNMGLSLNGGGMTFQPVSENNSE